MPEQPNIILINCDDLGYGDLGSYGSTRNDTPHLDQLAQDGMRFTDCYAVSPICSPSRAGLMTGCYPPRVGVERVLFPGEPIGLDTSEQTVAKQLKRAGYATQIVGKWHLGDQPEFLPTRHGFDHYFGLPYSNDMGRQVGREDSPPLPLMRDETVEQQQPNQRDLTERYTAECTRFIETNQDKPFFLYLAHMYVHVPLFVPKPFLDKSRNGGYGGAVACIDWSTGFILDTLKRLGLEDNTLVIFTSDNGSRARGEGGSNDPLRGHKQQTWEGGQRVPCLMRWPGRIEAGSTCDAIVRHIDLYPTLSALVGVDHPNPDTHPIDGVDISGLLFRDGTEPTNDTMAYFKLYQLEAVRMGDWKLHLRKENEAVSALFNLRDDPGEQHDLLDQHPDVVKRLRAFADEVRQSLGDSAIGQDGTDRRGPGTAENPKPLAEYDKDHPYVVAMYDMADMPTMCG
ncbi:sulfatase family protein [Algisphaera agarilytica]|uniref:Arylsulfatase A-like enzyme n=1 Tax=Algisphaera agarilytica TaxID=1385975 RepID=A0A7X0H5K5_9BACT|nr:sulfatase [Algisphaera agarilytica]MBB6429649.1 arylsulfatase A-like enzyme [Algisphaera agarilytica]